MVQMTPQDQAIVKAIPGNSTCCECGMKNPQWASVSFGTVFCLECSGVHRSLGVHISFVRSIAMDSWTDKQLALMKGGGNDKCNQYLQSKGIGPRTPIKQKYENDHAQLYKEILKARIEGRPEPTSIPRKPASAPSSMNNNNNGNRPMGSMSSNGMGGGAAGSRDPNGMERLQGETEQQYVARQTRLREEARARMAAKFGNNGGRMGGVGSNSGGMQGIGSNPNYNPNGGGLDLDNVVSGVTSVFSSGLSLVGSAAGTVASAVQDESTKQSISNIGSSVTSTAGSFWSSFSTGVSSVATSITQPDDADGLSSLQQQFHSQRPAQSKYGGFGSDNNGPSSSMRNNSNNNNNMMMMGGGAGGGGGLAEAPGLPGEDRNGLAKLTGESDEQYIARQTRIRDEAKARMAAKFGGGGLSSASSSSSAPYNKQTPSQPTGNYNPSYNSAPSSGNYSSSGIAAAPRSGGGGGFNPQTAAPRSGGVPQAPRSGGGLAVPQAPRSGGMAPVRKLSNDSADDFFASFGA